MPTERSMRSGGDAGLPQAYGELYTHWEPLSALDRIGWHPTNSLVGYKYDRPDLRTAGSDMPLWRKERQVGSFQRRPCDQFTLRSEQAAAFERRHPSYFKHPYQFSDSAVTDDAIARTLNLAKDEFCELPYLFPWARVVQAAGGFGFDPFVMRVWHFREHPMAFVKTANIELDQGARQVGAFIVSEPPSRGLLGNPALNYYRFRSVVAHEVAHLWWHSRGSRMPDLSAVRENPSHEQAISLFAVFLLMYRGTYCRRNLTRDETNAAFEGCQFETAYMRSRKDQFLDQLARLEFQVPEFIEPPEVVSRDLAAMAAENAAQRPSCALSEPEILILRDAARRIAADAEPIALASAAAVVMLRKIDCAIKFIADKSKWRADIAWRATDRRGRYCDGPPVPDCRWRDYTVMVPAEPGLAMSDGLYLSLARHLAHIRLHGGRPGNDGSPMRSEDIERRCTEAERDLARLTALVLCAHRGKRDHRPFSPGIARMLLMLDPSGLQELVPSVDDYFSDCMGHSPATPEHEKRFAVALSFSGDRRDYVSRVADVLTSALGRERVFYDKYFEAELARPNLDIYLQDIYHNESELIVVFLCAQYELKEWCGLEWRAIRDLIKARKEADVMPMRFDDSQISGMFSMDGYIDLDQRSSEEVARLILRRLARNRTIRSDS